MLRYQAQARPKSQVQANVLQIACHNIKNNNISWGILQLVTKSVDPYLESMNIRSVNHDHDQIVNRVSSNPQEDASSAYRRYDDDDDNDNEMIQMIDDNISFDDSAWDSDIDKTIDEIERERERYHDIETGLLYSTQVRLDTSNNDTSSLSNNSLSVNASHSSRSLGMFDLEVGHEASLTEFDHEDEHLPVGYACITSCPMSLIPV